MTAEIVKFERRSSFAPTAAPRGDGRARHLTAEQREHRREISRKPRRSKNGTPEERAAKAAASVGVEVKAISRSDVLLSDDVPPPDEGPEAATKEERALCKILRSRERAGWSAEEVRAQYHASELIRLCAQLSPQHQDVVEGLIETLSSKRR